MKRRELLAFLGGAAIGGIGVGIYRHMRSSAPDDALDNKFEESPEEYQRYLVGWQENHDNAVEFMQRTKEIRGEIIDYSFYSDGLDHPVYHITVRPDSGKSWDIHIADNDIHYRERPRELFEERFKKGVRISVTLAGWTHDDDDKVDHNISVIYHNFLNLVKIVQE